MSLEREAKLEVDPGFRMPDLSTSPDGLRSEPGLTERSVSTYHDTDDLRIVRWGGSLRYRTAEGWTVKLPRSVEGAVTARHEITFDADAGAPPAVAVELLTAIVRGAPVRPVVRLQTVRRRADVVADDGAHVADLLDDEVSVLDGRRIVDRFREVEVELSGDADDAVIDPIVKRLIESGARANGAVPKVVRAIGDRAAAPPDVTVPALSSHPTVADVVRWAMASSTERLVAHDAQVRLGEDPEAVHQARVATRRLRSDLRTFRAVLDADRASDLRRELGWLGAELGRVRDLDVLTERLERHAGGLPDDEGAHASALLGRLRVDREAVRTGLLGAMRDRRYVRLLDALVDSVSDPAVLDEVAEAPAADVLAAAMRAPWAHLQELCDSLGPRSSDEDLHAARIRAKRVRYAAEVLTPAFGKPARRFSRRAEALQRVLGAHQDAVMSSRWLRERSALASSGEAFVAGRLAAIDASRRDEGRAAWPDAWADLRRRKLRFWET